MLDIDPVSGMASWPDNWPKYWHSNTEPCDMAVGPCSCGAWHQAGEFVFDGQTLFRRGQSVAAFKAAKKDSA